MNDALRTRQRMFALALPLAAALYIGAEVIDPKGTDQIVTTTAIALKVLPIATKHHTQLYISGLAHRVGARCLDHLLWRKCENLPERRELAQAAIERVGLEHRIKARPNQLSGGEQQRTAIARALAAVPTWSWPTSPPGNLDTTTGKSILQLLQELHEEGTTIVVITHDLGVAAAMDRRIEIRDGRIVSDAPTDS